VSEATAEKLVKLLVPVLMTISLGLATYAVSTATANAQAVAVLQQSTAEQGKRDDEDRATLRSIEKAVHAIEVKVEGLKKSGG